MPSEYAADIATIKANTIIGTVMEALMNGTVSSGAFPVNEKLPIRTHMIGQAIVQKRAAFSLRNSLTVLLSVAVIWPN